MEGERKIPKRVQKILDRCSAGEVLCVTHSETHLGTKPEVWVLEPSNKVVSALSAREATAYLKPSCDGLFGADSSQTWRA